MNIKSKIFEVMKTEAVQKSGTTQLNFHLENLDLVVFQGDDYSSAYTGLCYEPLFDDNGALIAFKECSAYASVEACMNARLENECKIRGSIYPATMYGHVVVAAEHAVLSGDIAAFCKLCNKVATDAIENHLCDGFEDVTAAVEEFCCFMGVDSDTIRAFTGGSLWYRTEV